jgi:hypothetical protein
MTTKMPLTQIAETMGFRPNRLRSLLQRAKIDGKIPVVDLHDRREGRPLKPSAKVKRRNTEHGGGRWGISGCPCELCAARVKKSRAEVDSKRRGSLKDLHTQIEELLAEKQNKEAKKKTTKKTPKMGT